MATWKTACLLQLALALLCSSGLAQAAPLTYEEVLAYADQPHPDIALVQANVDLARADAALQGSVEDLRITLEGNLRTGRNHLTDDQFAPDHIARLNGRKLLWDSGRTRHGNAAAALETEARELEFTDARNRRRILLISRFFDALLSDMQSAADNEFTAVAYVAYDNAKDRQALGQLSPIALSEFEARYQELRQRRNESARKVREKRALLAAALNRPGDLPSELVDPDLTGNDRSLPGFEDLHAALTAHNPRLLAQRQAIAAAERRLQAAQSDTGPSLEAEAELAAYSRQAYTRDTVRAGLNLVWPFQQGQRRDARRAQEQARLDLQRSRLEQLQLELRQALFELREEIIQLRDTERPAALVNATYRDRMLEKAQAEYELELKTNLGSSMAETQNARMRRRTVEYRLALAWARLEALVGQPIEQIKEDAPL